MHDEKRTVSWATSIHIWASSLIVVFNIDKREDPKGTSQTSLRYFEEPSQTTLGPIPRRNFDRIPPLERLTPDTTPYRRGTDSLNGDTIPLVSTQARQRPSRLNDVITTGNLPVYNRSNERDYPISTRNRNGPSENEDAGYYVDYSPEHEQISLPYVPYFTFVSIYQGTDDCFSDTLNLFHCLCAYVLVPLLSIDLCTSFFCDWN